MISTFIAAAHDAGAFLLKQQSRYRITHQVQHDLTLDVDQQAQQLIIAHLRKYYPNMPIIAEENAKQHAEKNPLLTTQPKSFISIDPLDGTLPYSKGFPDWGVNIAYIENGQPTLGVIYLPASQQTLEVDICADCKINGQRLPGSSSSINIKNNGTANSFILGLDLHYATDPEFVKNVLSPLTPHLKLTRSLGSTAAMTVDFAAGRTDAHLNHQGGGIWDIATLGAVASVFDYPVTDLLGQPRNWLAPSTGIITSHCQDILAKIQHYTQLFII